MAQRLLWMIRHYRPDFGALSCPLLCRLSGPLDVAVLATAVDALTRRHESLRTTFAGRGARLTQRIHEPRTLPIAQIDLTVEADPRAALRGAVAAELHEPIDPEIWPARATLWRLGEFSQVFCLNLHHLVTDAWSTAILLRDLAALYGHQAGLAPVPPAAGGQYADFATWQQRLLDGDELSRHREYWRRQLTGTLVPRLDLARLEPVAARAIGGGLAEPVVTAGAVSLDLPRPVVAALRDLAKRHHTTLFSVLLGAFYAQLSLVTGERDLAVASMFANRSRPELRETVGLLANMVLLRCAVDAKASFADLIAGAHAAVVGAFSYQDLPYQLVPMDALAGAGRADDLVFQVMAPVRHTIVAGEVTFELMVPDDIGSRFRYELALTPVGERDIKAVLFHADGTSAAAADFLVRYADVLRAGTQNPAHPIAG